MHTLDILFRTAPQHRQDAGEASATVKHSQATLSVTADMLHYIWAEAELWEHKAHGLVLQRKMQLTERSLRSEELSTSPWDTGM